VSSERRRATILFVLLLGASGCKAAPVAHAPTATSGAASPTTASAPKTVAPAPIPRATGVPQVTSVARIGPPGLVTLSAGHATPEQMTIQAGRTVTWSNSDSLPHHPVSDETGLFDAGEIAPGEQATLTLSSAGTHGWHDVLDRGIAGTIRVMP
jgi:hypothetical protein